MGGPCDLGGRSDAHITFHLSESYAVAGDRETALRLLEQAVARVAEFT